MLVFDTFFWQDIAEHVLGWQEFIFFEHKMTRPPYCTRTSQYSIFHDLSVALRFTDSEVNPTMMSVLLKMARNCSVIIWGVISLRFDIKHKCELNAQNNKQKFIHYCSNYPGSSAHDSDT